VKPPFGFVANGRLKADEPVNEVRTAMVRVPGVQ
jgi:hypothetical protein